MKNGARAISPVQSFWVDQNEEVPAPPAMLMTTPYENAVKLDWLASPSDPNIVSGYLSEYEEVIRFGLVFRHGSR